MIKRELNMWQFVFQLNDDIQYIDGRKKLIVGIFSLKYFCKPGIDQAFCTDSYKGFIRQYWIRKPLERLRGMR